LGSAAKYEVICTGTVASVRLSPKAKEEYDALQARTDAIGRGQKQQLRRFIERFCSCEPHRLPQEHYRFEGRHPDGSGGKVAIYAFKPHGWRLYGAVLAVGKDAKCFVGVDVDPAKKKDKTDQAMLRSVALLIADLDEWKTGR
jgi:hypothetical protein